MAGGKRSTRASARKKPTKEVSGKDNPIKTKLDLYLADFDRKAKHEIELLEKQSEEMQRSFRNKAKLALMRLPTNIRKMTKKQYYEEYYKRKEQGPEEPVVFEPEVVELVVEAPSVLENSAKTVSSTAISIKQKGSKKKVTNSLKGSTQRRISSFSTTRSHSSRPRTLLRRSGRITSTRSIKRPYQRPCLTPGFTPKFDPKQPITPQSGLRRIKPGERFVLMSENGSPLMNDQASPNAVVSLNDGKAMTVSARSRVEVRDVDEDTRLKIQKLQEQLSLLMNQAS